MDRNRIKEIQKRTAYPESISVLNALLKVWEECETEITTLRSLLEDRDGDKHDGYCDKEYWGKDHECDCGHDKVKQYLKKHSNRVLPMKESL